MKLNKEDLKKLFELAIEEDMKYIAVETYKVDIDVEQIIIYPRVDFEKAYKYYDENFTDDLKTLLDGNEIILGYMSANDFFHFEEVIVMQ